MSIINRIRRVRQQTKDHNAKVAEQQKDARPTLYHHVPSHAATDAASSAPSPSRMADYARLPHVNHDRRFMESQELQPFIPRVGSNLSASTYATTESARYAHPYSPVEPSVRSVSLKGKEVDRSPYHSPHLSLSSSKGVFPYESSGNSQDMLDVRTPRSARRAEPVKNSRPQGAVGHPHRLHPSARSPSEASADRVALAQVAKLASTPIAQRGRLQQNLTPLPHTPTRPVIQVTADSRISPSRPNFHNSGAYSSFWERHSRQGSVSSLPALTPTSTKHHSSGPMTQQRSAPRRSSGQYNLGPTHSPLLDFDFQFDKFSLKSGISDMDVKNEQRRVSRSRYQEKEIIDPSVGLLDFGLPGESRRTSISTSKHIVNKFPEPSSPPTPTRRSKSWKMPKAGTKLLRKNHQRVDSKMTV